MAEMEGGALRGSWGGQLGESGMIGRGGLPPSAFASHG